MDALEKKLLLRELDQYGYSLVSTDSGEPSNVLKKLVESDDARLLEGIPVVLTNMLLQSESPNLVKTEKSLLKVYQKRFRILVSVTHFLLGLLPKSTKHKRVLSDYLKSREPGLLDTVKAKMKIHSDLLVGKNIRLDPERLKNTFENYVVNEYKEKEKSNYYQKLEEEKNAVFREALSELFTDKQIELLFKKLNKEELTKTESQYFSRVVKKRLKALSNPGVQDLASSVLG